MKAHIWQFSRVSGLLAGEDVSYNDSKNYRSVIGNLDDVVYRLIERGRWN